MDNNIASQITDMGQKVMDTVTALQKISERTMQDLAKQQLAAAEGLVATGSKQVKDLANIKTAQDAISAQAEITSEMGKMMVDNAKQTMEVLNRSQADLKALVEENVNEVMAKAKGSK